MPVSVIEFSLPLPKNFEGNAGEYQSFVGDAAREAVAKLPTAESSLWPAQTRNDGKLECYVIVQCEDIPYSNVEREMKIIVDVLSGTLWNPIDPEPKFSYVQTPWSRKGPRVKIRVVQTIFKRKEKK